VIARGFGVEARGLSLVAVSAVGFGTLGIFGKLAQRTAITLPTLLGLRFMLAAAVLWLLAVVRHDGLWPGRRRAGGLGIMGLLYVGQATAFFGSLRTVPAAITSILLYVYPAIVVVLARIVFGEQLRRLRMVALAVATAGVVLVVDPRPAGHLDLTGVLLGLASALVYSIYIIVGGSLLRGAAPLVATAYIATVAGAVFLVTGAFTGQLQGFQPAGWAVIAGIAIVPTVIAATAFVAGLGAVGPTRAAIVSTLEPVTTVILAAIVLGEALTPARIAGGVLVLVAALLVARTGAAGEPAMA
jgi:drug/metabolite transporter (DMT)-like permease